MTCIHRFVQLQMHSSASFGSSASRMQPLHQYSQRKLRLTTLAAGRSALKELQQLTKTNKSTNSKLREDRKLRPYTISPRLHVPSSIEKPSYVDTGEMPWGQEPEVHNPEGLEKMRAACRLAADVLKMAGSLVKPGVSTDLIDRKVHQMIIDHGAYPSPLTYGRFPKSVCTSVNECVCHGIPDARTLKEGDVVNVDVTVYLNGYHGDTSSMFYAGKPGDRSRWLCDVNREALYEGIKQCGPGVPVNAIGKAIHNLADRHKVAVCPDFVGHGVGRHFHANPIVSPVRNRDRTLMIPNQTFTIEPIFIDGNPRHQMWRDGWTVVTRDGSLTAQHEHTVLITENGHEILT